MRAEGCDVERAGRSTKVAGSAGLQVSVGLRYHYILGRRETDFQKSEVVIRD